jgi:type IV secretory pathway TrbD component
MLVSFAVAALGAALVLVSSGQSRWAGEGVDPISDGIPAARALALLAFAALGLSLLLEGWARSIFGVLLALIGAVVLLLNSDADPRDSALRGVYLQMELHRSVPFWMTVVGGVVLAVGGLLMAIWGHRWPGPRRNYGAPTEQGPPQRDDAWGALDRGEDPTI